MMISIETAAVTMEVWRQWIKVTSGVQDVHVRTSGWALRSRGVEFSIFGEGMM